MKVVVFLCDSYTWLMQYFLHFYEKNWPNNPYKTEFVTETKKIEGVTAFYAGKIPWTDRTIKYLESYNEETFLFLLNDFIINKPINTNIIKKAKELCVGNIGCVRLNAHDSWSQFLFDANIDGFKEYPLDKPYSISLQAVIWQKKFFLEFLQAGENIWQVEHGGSKRVHNSKYRIIWVDVPVISYHPSGFVRKGKVSKSVKQWVGENW